ncbi:MAG TPA: glycosyltransferase family protein, partial [Polyangia bacterium]|nr:glycosyltransferase family protein [Polyangia bacterium]
PENIKAYVEITERFEPEVVISDFESWSYLFAQRHGLPLISVDNMQIINRCEHAPEITAGAERDFELTKAIVKAKVAGADHYHITTFFYPPVRKERTTLHPPILRPEILAAKPAPGDHLLVYQTSTSNTALPDILRRTGRECRIYGLRRDLKEEVVEGNLRYQPFSEARFIDDLRTARGVIASAGFTLMGEAVYLHRPMLAVPVAGQFEQVLNARYLEREGYGLAADELTDERLGQFLERLPDCERKLASYTQDGNRDLLDALKGSLAAAKRPR